MLKKAWVEGENEIIVFCYTIFVMGYKCFWMMPIRRQAVRFKLDRAKSKEIERRWGFSLEQAKSIFEHPTYFERRENYPGQFLVIGLLDDLRLVSVAIKPLSDEENDDVYELVTAWKATNRERKLYGQHC